MAHQLQQFLAMIKFEWEWGPELITSTHTMQSTKTIINNVFFLNCEYQKDNEETQLNSFSVLHPENTPSRPWQWLLDRMASQWDYYSYQQRRMVRYCNEFKHFPKALCPVLEIINSPCATNLPKVFPKDQDLSLCDLSGTHMPPLLRHHILLD